MSSDDEVQVVVPWDASLPSRLTSSAERATSHLRSTQSVYMLLNIVSRPSEEYFLSGTSQATDFEKLKKQCRAGWTSVLGRNRVWTMAYKAKKLALLLVLCEQVDLEKKVRDSSHAGGAPAGK